MFRKLMHFGAVVALATPLQAWAACGLDSIPLDILAGVPYVTLTPSQPNAQSPINFEVAMVSYFPDHVTAALVGGTIRLSFYGGYFGGVPPNLSCVSATLGPLPAGHYPVEVEVSDSSTPPTTFLVATGGIDVTATPTGATFSAPTLSPWSIVALIGMLGLGGLVLGRRRMRA